MKTYSHLAGLKHVPTEYEIGTTGLLYYPARGFEVDAPLKGWYEKYQRGSPLQCSDWDRFTDPRQTTYTRYVTLQKQQEAGVEAILQSIEDSGSDRFLSPAALELLRRFVAPLRYPFHGLQMAAAYVGHMAPGGRVVVAALMQAGDEIRRIQHVAYRIGQLRRTHPAFGDDGRGIWERDPAFQPLREVLERLLVTYDWGEAFVALNLCLKPAVDDFVVTRLAGCARAAGDHPLAELLFALRADCAWQRAWTDALVTVTITDQPANREHVERWTAEWRPRAGRAIAALAEAVEAVTAGVAP